jgi:hypothetical protein
MKVLSSAVLAAMLFCGGITFAARLPPNTQLLPGQSLFSDNGQYQLVMQGDGNLVYYRLPGNGVRFNTQTQGNPGAWSVMQGDGNFVVYTAGGSHLWNAGTNGWPGAYLAAQDDGNLVVYSSGGQALWHIGADPFNDNPKLGGDVVGRSLSVPFPGSVAGHIALWDGGNVVEVLNEPQVVQYNSLSYFKSRSDYWGAASPNIPIYYVRGCYNDGCGQANGNGYQTVTGRINSIYRAFQIYVLGVDYTHTAIYTRAQPRYYDTNSPIVKGVYRCDTFVFDTYNPNGIATRDGQDFNNLTPAQNNWLHFVYQDLGNGFIPSLMFSKLKNYPG